jgi:hypothetical protein
MFFFFLRLYVVLLFLQPSSHFDEPPDYFDLKYGSFDDGDPQTTNLYVGNLSPKVLNCVLNFYSGYKFISLYLLFCFFLWGANMNGISVLHCALLLFLPYPCSTVNFNTLQSLLQTKEVFKMFFLLGTSS